MAGACRAQGSGSEIPSFTREDRVLVLAPHPDDETIGACGVIQRALAAGSKVKVVLFTNGDNNEFAFIVYEKRVVFKKAEFLRLGEVRRKESLLAMASLGLSHDNVVLLGYPDFGTMEILTKYWKTPKPYKSLLTRVNKVAYPEAMSPGAPYVGESVLKDLEKVLSDFRPTKIFVSHPLDTNRDHRSLYLFLQVALWNLEGKLTRLAVHPYLVHIAGWPKPRGHHPELALQPPEKLKNCGVFWQKLELTGEEAKKKYDTVSFYKSQIEYNPPYLFSFARKNELFGDFPVIKLQDSKTDAMGWFEVGVPEENQEEEEPKASLSTLAYALKEEALFIKLTLKRRIAKDLGISIFLLGYSNSKDFSEMPKINLHIGIGGFRVKDKKQPLFIRGVKLKYQKNAMIIRVPLAVLGDPRYILASAKAVSPVLPFDDTAWRIIEVQK